MASTPLVFSSSPISKPSGRPVSVLSPMWSKVTFMEGGRHLHNSTPLYLLSCFLAGALLLLGPATLFSSFFTSSGLGPAWYTISAPGQPLGTPAVINNRGLLWYTRGSVSNPLESNVAQAEARYNEGLEKLREAKQLMFGSLSEELRQHQQEHAEEEGEKREEERGEGDGQSEAEQEGKGQQQQQQQGRSTEDASPKGPEGEAAAFLEKYLEFPGADKCGDWAETYSLLHKRMRGGKSMNPRYLIFYGRDGLGDRINGLVTSFIVALLTQRALIVADPRLPLAFDPAEIDWSVPPELKDVAVPSSTELDRNVRMGFQNTTGEEEQTYFRFWGFVEKGTFPPNIIEAFSRSPKSPVLRLSTNWGVLAELLDETNKNTTALYLRSLGLNLENAHACILRYLMKPKKELLPPLYPLVSQLRLQSNTASMCFHVRVDDKKAWNPKGSLSLTAIDKPNRDRLVKALDCGNAVWQSLPDATALRNHSLKWLVLSNWPPVVEEARKQYPDRVLGSPVKPLHINMGDARHHAAAMQSTVQDWVLFSLCDYYFLSNSGFSKTSAVFSISRRLVPAVNLYKMDWYNDIDPKCDAKNTFSLVTLGTTGSRL